MNAVVKIEPAPPSVQAPTETAAILAVIERAASNPAVDIDKMERLLQMQERVVARQASAAFAEDMANMQSEMPSIGERGQADRYKFALWEDINRLVKPVLQKFGFALTFRTDFSDGIKVTGVLMHRAGHREETSIKMPSDKSGNKNDVQAIGSAVSYGKRYTACALLNITSHGEDDDAFRTADQPPPYDATDWYAAIDGAESKDALDKLAVELKASKAIPASVMRNIRAAWAKRAKELRS